MLQALLDELTAFHMICTYNGKSFDLPRTRSRCLHHQLDPTPLTRLRHVDLVHTARQKLSKLDHKLSLGMMEQVLLQFTRHGDLPGSEVPRRWFQFLASQNASLLDEIREHNLIDVVSLAALLERFVQRAPLPGAPPSQQALPLAKSQPEAPPQLAARQPPAQLAAMSPLQKKLTRSYELHALSASRPRATRSTDESEGGEEARDTLTSTRDWRIGPRVVTLIQHLQLKLDAGDPITAHPLLIMELAALAPQHLQVLEWLATYYDRLGATHCAEAIRQRAP